MTSFVKLKKALGILLFLLLFFLSVALPARSETTLTSIEKQEDPNRTRLIFSLSSATEFSVDHSGQRVDLVLTATDPAETLRSLPEDGTIVRMTLIRKQQDLIISLLLRRPPSLVVTESQSNPPRVMLDLNWRGDDSARPAIAFRMGDMPARIAGASGSRLQQQSPWDGHWQEFFRDYRSPWNIQLPLDVTPPPPLQLISDEQSPLWPLQQYADENLYLSLLQHAATLTDLSDQERYQRDLMAAEAYLRTGSYAVGLMRLTPLRGRTGDLKTRVDYLTGWGELARQNPIEALLYLQTHLAALPVSDPLVPEVTLLFAEAALGTSQYQLALDRLTDADLLWPHPLEIARLIRHADALLGLDQRDVALEIYQQLANQQVFCDFYRSSCSRAAYAAVQTGDYVFAHQLYQRLTVAVGVDEAGADLIHFAASATAYETGDFDWGWIGLEQTQQEYRGREGGDRAQLRLLDIRIINGDKQALEDAVSGYARLGRDSVYRQIRDESFFKEALALFLLEQHHESVLRLMTFKRDFRSSPLRREADLLLGRQLPLVVDKMLVEKKDLEAVVLVEQNRDLLLASGYDRVFLNNLAMAFERLGLYDRATRVLLYLFDRTANAAARSALYLPLAKSYFLREQYSSAQDYARQYLDLYPDGPDAGAMFSMLLDILEQQQRYDEIQTWLQRANRPRSADAEIRAAQIYWQQDNFAAVVTSLERAAVDTSLNVKEMARLAESHYRLNNLTAARNYYSGLFEDPEFGSQARYRNAQILLQQGNRAAAIEQLRQLVSTNGASAWGKLARDLLSQQERRNF